MPLETTRGDAPNPLWRCTEYRMADDCSGRHYADKAGPPDALPDSWNLWDGARWYGVPPEVFELWLRAYELGVQEGLSRGREGVPPVPAGRGPGRAGGVPADAVGRGAAGAEGGAAPVP